MFLSARLDALVVICGVYLDQPQQAELSRFAVDHLLVRLSTAFFTTPLPHWFHRHHTAGNTTLCPEILLTTKRR